MDIPGQSMFMGGSIHLDGIRPPDQDDEEDEEESRQREAEIQGMLAHAFDDLEEDESFANSTTHYSVSNRSQPPSNVEGYAAAAVAGTGVPEPSSYPGSIISNGKYVVENHSLHSQLDRSHHSHSYSQTPWSDDSDDHSSRFSPMVYQETGRDSHITDEDRLSSNLQNSFSLPADSGNAHKVPLSYGQCDPYSADRYRSHESLKGEEETSKRNEYREADSAHDQLRLLYEARGRELDKVMTELAKVKSDNLREVRVLQHQRSLLTSENESRKSNLNHFQILMSEKDEMVKKLKDEITDLQKRNHKTEDENKKLKLELETAESSISSLECQISELIAADNLSRNQMLHEEFVKKLRKGNQDEKDLLVRKVQDLQQESESYQQEMKNLREELKSLRRTHDNLLIQKTETATKLSVTVETLQKQYEDLLQSHSSHKILELQMRNKSLESEKERMEEKLKFVNDELTKAKEEIKGYDSAFMFGIFSEATPGEDSMVQLGIKRSLNYDETALGESNKPTKETLNEVQVMLKLKDELKRSLIANKAKRDNITQLQDDIREKQDQLRKAHSDLKSSQCEIKELKENVLKLKLDKAESQVQDNVNAGEKDSNTKVVQVENISLKQELVYLYGSLREVKQVIKNFSEFVDNVREKLNESHTLDINGLLSHCSKLLQAADKYDKLVLDLEQYRKVNSVIREENVKLQEQSSVWEKRLQGLEIKLIASRKMIETALTDSSSSSEYIHAQNVLQKLLGDIKQEVVLLKENSFTIQGKNIYLEDQLRTIELLSEKQKQDIIDLTEEKESLQVDMVNLTKRKEEEKAVALQNCQDTYLKFHEDAVKELESKFNAEYENIGGRLKNEITRLAEELCTVKRLYVEVCEEKDEIEGKLKKEQSNLPGSVSKLTTTEVTPVKFSQSSDDGERFSVTVTPDVESLLTKINKLQKELVDVRGIHEDDKKKFETEKEALEQRYENQMASQLKEVQVEMLERIKELDEKCTALDKSNLALKKKVGSHEEGAPSSGLNSSVAEEALAGELQKCQQILQEQRSRFEVERGELQTQFQSELSILKGKLITANELRAKEVEALHSLKAEMQLQEKQVLSLKEELAVMKESTESRDQESERVVQKLTDMILNLESEAKERQEELCKREAAFQRTLKDLTENQHFVKQRLKTADEEVAKLKIVSAKYNALKRKFKEYHEASDEQRTYYKGEINRLNSDFINFKETLIKRVQDYVEEVKKRFMVCLQSAISALKNYGDSDKKLYHMRQRLEEVNKEVESFILKLS